MKNKLLFLIFLMFPTLMLADYTFIVENQAMVESYFNIFNAISALLSSEDYLDLLRLTFLLGGFFVFASSVLTAWEGSANAKILSPYGKYLITGVALLTLVFSYKEPIWVTTNNIPSFCATPPSGMGGATPGGTMVGTAVNLPSVLGFVFSTTNKIGDGLTKLAESAFSTPSSTGTASMTDSGGYLGALKQTISIMSYNPSAVNMVDSTGNTIDGSADFLNLWGTFFSQCVYAVANNKGKDGDTKINQIKSSKNIFAYIEDYIKNYTYPTDNKPVRKYLVESNGTHYECGTFYEELTKKSADKLKNNFACSNPKMNGGIIELLTGNTTGATVSSLNEIALQSGLINALSVSGSINSVGINGANFVEGKSRAEASQNNLASASYMAQMLPYIQMTMRAILYAFFPFVFVVMLLPGGIKVLAQYGQTILWIELWTPTAAVVNMFVNMQVKDQVGGAYGTTGLTYMSSINMLGDANTIAGVGAMLYLSIPALTWLILKGSGQMLGNVAGGVMGTFGKNLDSTAVSQDMAQIKASKQSGKSISDTINSLEQMEVANKYGQAIGFENAGGMNSSMKNAQIKTQSELSSTVEKINAMGGVNSVINSNVAKDLKGALTDQKHLRETGMLDQNNNLNHKTINELSKTDAGAQAIQTLSNNKDFKNWATSNGKDPNNINAISEYTEKISNIKSNDNITGLTTKEKEQEKTNVTKNGQFNASGSNSKAEIDSETKSNEFEINKGLQELNSSKDIVNEGVLTKTTSIKTANDLKENLGSGSLEKTAKTLGETAAQQKATDAKSIIKTNEKFGNRNIAEEKISDSNSSNNFINSETTNKVVEKENLKNIVDTKVTDERTKINTTKKNMNAFGGEDNTVNKISTADSSVKQSAVVSQLETLNTYGQDELNKNATFEQVSKNAIIDKQQYASGERQKEIPKEIINAREKERKERNDTDPNFKKLSKEQQDFILNKDMANSLKKQNLFDETLTASAVSGDLNNINKRTIGAYAEKVIEENPNLMSSEKEMDNFTKHKELLNEKKLLEEDIKKTENSFFAIGLDDKKEKLSEINKNLDNTKNDYNIVNKNNKELANKTFESYKNKTDEKIEYQKNEAETKVLEGYINNGFVNTDGTIKNNLNESNNISLAQLQGNNMTTGVTQRLDGSLSTNEVRNAFDEKTTSNDTIGNNKTNQAQYEIFRRLSDDNKLNQETAELTKNLDTAVTKLMQGAAITKFATQGNKAGTQAVTQAGTEAVTQTGKQAVKQAGTKIVNNTGLSTNYLLKP